MARHLSIFLLIILLCISINAQQDKNNVGKNSVPVQSTSALRSSAAYAEVILRKVEIQSDLESMETEYTDDYPKVKEARTALTLIQTELARLAVVKPADSGKLTAGLGKLIVRKVELETALIAIRGQYDDKHPDVVSAKKKVDVFEKAIGEILAQ